MIFEINSNQFEVINNNDWLQQTRLQTNYDKF